MVGKHDRADCHRCRVRARMAAAGHRRAQERRFWSGPVPRPCRNPKTPLRAFCGSPRPHLKTGSDRFSDGQASNPPPVMPLARTANVFDDLVAPIWGAVGFGPCPQGGGVYPRAREGRGRRSGSTLALRGADDLQLCRLHLHTQHRGVRLGNDALDLNARHADADGITDTRGGPSQPRSPILRLLLPVPRTAAQGSNEEAFVRSNRQTGSRSRIGEDEVVWCRNQPVFAPPCVVANHSGPVGLCVLLFRRTS
jgi:hypothetical protein